MSSVLRRQKGVRVYWHAQHVVDECELVRRPYGWRWENGRILDHYHVERAYIHFYMLKRTLRTINFSFADQPTCFHITPRGFVVGKQPWPDRLRLPPM